LKGEKGQATDAEVRGPSGDEFVRVRGGDV